MRYYVIRLRENRLDFFNKMSGHYLMADFDKNEPKSCSREYTVSLRVSGDKLLESDGITSFPWFTDNSELAHNIVSGKHEQKWYNSTIKSPVVDDISELIDHNLLEIIAFDLP